jgi:hypothetical protein
LVFYQTRNSKECVFRGAMIGVGSLLPIYMLLVIGLVSGSSRVISNFVHFLDTAKQGGFREGWSLPWEYLWHSEHTLLLIWLICLVIALVLLLKKKLSGQKYVIYWIAASLVIYSIFIFGSTVFEKFVIYGRFARELIPFFCLIMAFSVYRFRDIFLKHRVFSVLGILFLIIQATFNFYPPIVQKWPKDFYNNVNQVYGKVYRDAAVLGPSIKNDIKLDRNKKNLVVLNIDFLYPIIEQKPGYSGKLLMKENHPLAYWPYQYEGWAPQERKILRASNLSMELIEVNPFNGVNQP